MILNKLKFLREVKKYAEKINRKIRMDIQQHDRQIDSVLERISRLESKSHSPREFVECNKCKNKNKEKE